MALRYKLVYYPNYSYIPYKPGWQSYNYGRLPVPLFILDTAQKPW